MKSRFFLKRVVLNNSLEAINQIYWGLSSFWFTKMQIFKSKRDQESWVKRTLLRVLNFNKFSSKNETLRGNTLEVRSLQMSSEERSTVFGIPNVEYRISFLSSNWMSATQSTNTLTKQLTVHESQSLYWKPSDLDWTREIGEPCLQLTSGSLISKLKSVCRHVWRGFEALRRRRLTSEANRSSFKLDLKS